MRKTALTARRLLERTGEHPVISVYFDLDPEEFATAPARATQARSLLDEAGRTVKSDGSLGHQDRVTIGQDLERIGSFLQSDELPVSGARAVAVFCSGQDQLFEAVRLTDAAASRVVIAHTPYVEPLVVGHDPGRWCVALVNRRVARIFDGAVHELHETRELADDVHGQHRQGGWSQRNYERSYENEADAHLRSVAQELYREWQRAPFQTLVLGGPTEVAARLVELLHPDLRPTLSEAQLDLDVTATSESELHDAVRPLLVQAQAGAAGKALARLSTELATGGRAVAGVQDTLQALSERRVGTLLLSADFQAAGGRCPSCGLLAAAGQQRCPADGSELEPLPDLREAAVEAALLQDAEVIAAPEPSPELRRGEGIGALLRF